ncbi:MAG: acyl-CoA dehydrogenase family protein [Acidobacteriota bacterium]|nr:acyl-CoA dehydrogenase family protein [Acidobacteriota bacterium]
MEFLLDPAQLMLQQSVARFLQSQCALDRVREIADAEQTIADDVYESARDLEIPGILIPEKFGGVGLGFLEAALIAETLGYAVAPVPFTATSVMAPTALLAGGSDAQKTEWLPRLASGEKTLAVGVTEQIARRTGYGVTALDGKLDGTAMFVLEAMEADAYLLADAAGAFHLVAGDAPGLDRNKLKTVDRTRSVAEVSLDSTPAEVLPGSVGNGEPLHATIDAGRLMLAADTLGAAQAMLNQAVAYAKERRQFNRPIGSFQAVKHMCSEMAAELEPCRSLVWYAAHSVAAIPSEARLMICHAKAHLAEVGQFVARTATEVHGGMGFTDLLGLHYWFKRIGFNRQMLGGPELIRDDAARAQGLLADSPG